VYVSVEDFVEGDVRIHREYVPLGMPPTLENDALAHFDLGRIMQASPARTAKYHHLFAHRGIHRHLGTDDVWLHGTCPIFGFSNSSGSTLLEEQ
jgi:hypothetical protein